MVAQRRTVSVLIQGQNQTGPAFKQAMADTAALEKSINHLNATMRHATGQFGILGGALRGIPAVMGGIMQAAGAMTGALVSAGAAVVGLASAAAGLSGVIGIQLASEMEQTEVRFMSFLKSADLVKEALTKIRVEADKTPFSFRELSSAAAMLGTTAVQTGKPLFDLIRQAEILGAARPDQGIVGAAFSLREAASGDFTSIVERFDLPRQRLNQLKKEGVPGIEAVSRVMKELSMDMKLVEDMSKTLTGRWSTFMDLLDGFRMKMAASPFASLKSGLETISTAVENNRGVITAYAEKAGVVIAAFIDRAVIKITELVNALPTLLMMFEHLYINARMIWQGIADVIWEAATTAYQAFQYLNPWARHSPSLVEQVQSGVEAIAQSFLSLPQAIDGPMRGLQEGFAAIGDLIKDGISGPKEASALESAFKQQEQSIRMTEMALIPYERALERARQGVAALASELQAAENALRYFQNAPLKGESAFEDALFANSQAMAALRLEQMAMEEAGPGRGFANKRAFAGKRRGIEAQMARLRRDAEKTSLVKQLTIDPQKRALAQIGKQTEISFTAAMQGAQGALEAMTRIQPALVTAQQQTAAMEADLSAQRDTLQEQKDLLDQIKTTYGGIIDAIKAADAAEKAKKKEPPAPPGGGIPKIGGDTASGLPGREPEGAWAETKPNKNLTDLLATIIGIRTNMTFVNDGVKTFFAAIRGDWQPGEGIAEFHDVMGRLGLAIHGLAPTIKWFWEEIVVKGTQGAVTLVKQLLEGDLQGAWNTLLAGVMNLGTMIAPHIESLTKTLGGWIIEAGKQLMKNGGEWVNQFLRFLQDNAPTMLTKIIGEWAPMFIAAMLGVTVELVKWLTIGGGYYEIMKLGGLIAKGVLEGLALGFANLGILLHNAFVDAINSLDIEAGPIRIKGKEFGLTKQRMLDAQDLITNKAYNPVLSGKTPIPKQKDASQVDSGTPRALSPLPPQHQPPPARPGGPAKDTGYAWGGDFLVGGMGGSDSQRVSFMATPGERVVITPPGRGGSDQPMIVVSAPLIGNVVVRDDRDLDELRREIRDLPRRLDEHWSHKFNRTVGRGNRRPLGLARSTT